MTAEQALLLLRQQLEAAALWAGQGGTVSAAGLEEALATLLQLEVAMVQAQEPAKTGKG